MDTGTAILGQARIVNKNKERLRAVALNKLTKVGYHHDGGGLYLQVREGVGGLTRSWVLRFMRQGKARMMGLGEFPTITLAEARGKALEARKMLQAGVDPIEARDARRAQQAVPTAPRVTFQQAAEAYQDAHAAGWSAIHAGQWRTSMRYYAFPKLGALPVAAIEMPHVLEVVEPIWAGKTETANRVRSRIEKVLDWATVRGLRQGDNPARWKGHLEHILPARGKVRRVKHFPALPYQQVAEFMVELRAREGVSARALEFVILTAARSGEATGARWSEFNLAERVWVVPPERIKAGREHRVPLSDAALAILDQMQGVRFGDYVFPGAKPNSPPSENTFFDLLQRMKRGDITAHGFRSTFMDWATECTNYPSEMRDLALAHKVSDKVEAAYRRGDMFKRRAEMMAAWAGWCDGATEAAQNVVPLRAGGGGS